MEFSGTPFSALEKFCATGSMQVKLLEKKKITHDSYIFVFDLPDPQAFLGLGVGHCVVVGGNVTSKSDPKGEMVYRKYTPISTNDMKGKFEMIIKIYRAGVHPAYPEGGKFTTYLENLKLGDKVEIFPCKKKFTYLDHGSIMIKNKLGKREMKVKEIGLICGGSGIAPIYQVMRAIADDAKDPTLVKVLFANKSIDDILLKQELDSYSKNPKVKMNYVVDKAPAGWSGFEGYITKEMLKATMPAPAKDIIICFSGPKPMNKLIIKLLTEMGYDEESMFKF